MRTNIYGFFPDIRKKNRYCQNMGMTSLFEHNQNYSPLTMIEKVGEVKYFSLNTNQLRRTGGKRRTVEFRIIEGQGCKDPYLMKNWIRLILHFVEMVKQLPYPSPY